MGYSTNFSGQFNLDKPLTLAQYNELKRFADKDHRDEHGMPGYYCQWIPTEEGTSLEWDGNEKFYDYVEWLEYLIEHFLQPWGYTVNGEVTWQGEDVGDLGTIYVGDNVIATQKYEHSHEIPICDKCGFSYDIREPHKH